MLCLKPSHTICWTSLPKLKSPKWCKVWLLCSVGTEPLGCSGVLEGAPGAAHPPGPELEWWPMLGSPVQWWTVLHITAWFQDGAGQWPWCGWSQTTSWLPMLVSVLFLLSYSTYSKNHLYHSISITSTKALWCFEKPAQLRLLNAGGIVALFPVQGEEEAGSASLSSYQEPNQCSRRIQKIIFLTKKSPVNRQRWVVVSFVRVIFPMLEESWVNVGL